MVRTIRNATRCNHSGEQVTQSRVPRGVSVRCGCGKLLKLTTKGTIPTHNRNVRRDG